MGRLDDANSISLSLNQILESDKSKEEQVQEIKNLAQGYDAEYFSGIVADYINVNADERDLTYQETQEDPARVFLDDTLTQTASAAVGASQAALSKLDPEKAKVYKDALLVEADEALKDGEASIGAVDQTISSRQASPLGWK